MRGMKFVKVGMVGGLALAFVSGSAFGGPATNSVWHRTEISKEQHHALPAWSPDGKTLAFVSYTNKQNLHVWITDVEGKNQRMIWEGKPFVESNSWEMDPAALIWLRNPSALMLTVSIREKTASTGAFPPPGLTEIPVQTRIVGSGGATNGSFRVQAFTSSDPFDRKPLEIRAFLLDPEDSRQSRQIVRMETSRLNCNLHRGTVDRAASLPDGAGIALCFDSDPDCADEWHAAALVTVKRNGVCKAASHRYWWIRNLPDGRLIGGRLDGVWVLDAEGEGKEALLRFEKPTICTAFQISPDGRRMLWADSCMRGLRWRIREQEGTDRPLTVQMATNAMVVVRNAMFLSNDKVIFHAQNLASNSMMVAEPDTSQAGEWMPGLLPRDVVWSQIAPWGNAAIVMGRHAAAGTAACAVFRIKDGKPVTESIGEAKVEGLPMMDPNWQRAMLPLVEWAPTSRVAFAQTSETRSTRMVVTIGDRTQQPAEPASRILITYADSP